MRMPREVHCGTLNRVPVWVMPAVGQIPAGSAAAEASPIRKINVAAIPAPHLLYPTEKHKEVFVTAPLHGRTGAGLRFHPTKGSGILHWRVPLSSQRF
jgi:hypothetical protein